MKTRQVGPGFAVEISDLALNKLHDRADIDAFKQAWMENKVAVLRDQQLDDDELLAFTRHMGPLFVHVRSMFHSREYPEIMFVSNLKADGRPLGSLGDGDLGWHTDQCYTARPCWGTLLYGIEIPDDGGDTCFHLPDELAVPF